MVGRRRRRISEVPRTEKKKGQAYELLKGLDRAELNEGVGKGTILREIKEGI